MTILLSAKNVSKSFGGVRALFDLSLDIKRGAIQGLIGPNGAGKTTFFNVLTGLYSADKGSFFFAGAPYQPTEIHEVVRIGIARTFQNIRLFTSMTVLENVLVGFHGRTSAGLFGAIFRSSRVARENQWIVEQGMSLLNYVGIGHMADKPAVTLPYGFQRRLEIARALATNPKLLALDEPAAGMNRAEKVGLADLINRLRDDGKTILLIEHDVKLVTALCDEIVVLNFGEVLAKGTPLEITSNKDVIDAYLGCEVF